MNGIILDGKAYQAVPRGSRHCNDCNLYDRCKADPQEMSDVCIDFTRLLKQNIIFKTTDL